MNERFPKVVSFAFLLLLISIACENNLDPFAENNEYRYSIFGILDASADTNWVRVMPIRKSTSREAIPNDAKVTLIKKSTGERIELEDTLIELAQNKNVWGFWTITEILPEHTYTIEAESPEGTITTSTVTIPPNFSALEIVSNGNTYTISFDPDIQHLVVSDIIYTFRFISPFTGVVSYPQIYRISYLNEINEFADRDEFSFDPYMELAEIYEALIISLSGEVTIVSADSNWYGIKSDKTDLPNIKSNIQNGLGVLTGIVSKQLPLKPNVEGQEHLGVCPAG